MQSVVVKYPEIGATYKHYKGGLYKVHKLALDDNGVQVVVYESLIFGSWHTKPLSMWFDPIPHNIEAGIGLATFRFMKQ